MLKVFGFVRRNEMLTHDEYRAAHAGYHNSYGRRLRKIRGYLLNVRANRPMTETLGDFAGYLNGQEPPGFDDYWDGYGQLMFDSLNDYFSAKAPAMDKPGPHGLEVDDSVAGVGGDAPFLYSGAPCQFHVREQVVLPVRRPEQKIFKLVMFGKRRREMPREAFEAVWGGAYAALSRNTPGLVGHLVNFPTDLDVINGFFAPESGAFSNESIRGRGMFMAHFDGMAEYWFATPEAFRAWRAQCDAALRDLEQELFDSFFFREVDETVAVLPDRLPPAPFFHR